MTKYVTLEVVKEPENFSNVRFRKDDYLAAKKMGEIRNVPYGTARENIRNSAGMYRIKPEETAVQEHVIKGLKDPEEMTASELMAEMTAHGKPPRKQMQRSVAVDFVKDLRAKAESMIVPDKGSEDDDE